MIEPQDLTDHAAPGQRNGSTSRLAPSGITVSEVKGIPVHRRKMVEAAVVAGGSSLSEDFEGWIVPARKPPGFAVRLVGPRGFYREIKFAGSETEAEIEASVRRAIEL